MFKNKTNSNQKLLKQSDLKCKKTKIGNSKYQVYWDRISVSIDREDSKKGHLQIPYCIIKSNSEKKERTPVFFLCGGPGDSNLQFDFPVILLENHDVVLVGYRGIDCSKPFNFKHSKKVMKALGDELSWEYLERLAHAEARDVAEAKADGIHVENYTMIDVIDDVEDVRRHLGYSSINLFSESYGTRVAYIYSIRYPESLNRSVMLCVNPPGRFVWEPGMLDQQLADYNRIWCCNPENLKKSSNLIQSMKSSFENLPKRWFGIRLSPAKIKIMSFIHLYNRKRAALLFDAFVKAGKGDYSGLALLSILCDITSANWGETLFKGGTADLDVDRNYFQEMNPKYSILGSPISMLHWVPMQINNIIEKMIPECYRKLCDVKTETLLINGSLDVSTPPTYAMRDLLPHLRNGKSVLLKEMAHCGDICSSQPNAFRKLVLTYLADGEVDTSDYKYEEMDFKVTIGYPVIAKTLLSIAIGVFAIVMFSLFVSVF